MTHTLPKTSLRPNADDAAFLVAIELCLEPISAEELDGFDPSMERRRRCMVMRLIRYTTMAEGAPGWRFTKAGRYALAA